MSPATGFADLPASWSCEPLAGVAKSVRKTAKIDPGEPYELWSIPSFSRGAPEQVVGSDIGSGKLLVQPRDVLISKINPRINRVWLVNEAPDNVVQVASTEWLVARIDDTAGVLPGFLQWYARSPTFRAMIVDGVQGVTGSHTRAKTPQVLKLPVPVPPLSEQQRIVEILEEQLSRLDAAIDSVRMVREKAAQLRRSLLHSAFTGALTGDGRVVDGVPDGWESVTLSDVVDHKSQIVDGPFGSHLKGSHYTETGARVVRLQNIGFGSYVAGDAFISLDHYESLAKHNVIEGDLLFASLGENLPRTCLAPDLDGPAIVKADCIRVRLSETVNRDFVLYATQRPDARRWASEQSHGMGRPRLGLAGIRSFPLPLPPRSEQDKIVALLNEHFASLDASLAVADAIEQRSAALRRSLLRAAFTGRLTEEWRGHAHV